jgi:hypothetical protein
MRTVEPTNQVIMASRAIERGVGELLGSKHLYQSVLIQVKVEGLLVEIKTPGDGRKELIRSAEAILDGCDWIVAMGDGAFPMDPGNLLPFYVPVVRAWCDVCKEKTPFHLETGDKSRRSTISLSPQRQIFCVPMLCHGCKQEHLAFMFTRNRRKLTLTGREPIEFASAPQFVPGAQARVYSDAIIATGAGHILAGLFYLRTLIEQHMRSIVGGDTCLRGDDLSTAYARTLDKDIRSRLPSFGKLYEKLSAALHAARADEELFTECLQAIESHFEAKAAFAKIAHIRQPKRE